MASNQSTMSVYVHIIPNDNRHYGMTRRYLAVLSNGIALFSAPTETELADRIERDLQRPKLSKTLPTQVIRVGEGVAYC